MLHAAPARGTKQFEQLEEPDAVYIGNSCVSNLRVPDCCVSAPNHPHPRLRRTFLPLQNVYGGVQGHSKEHIDNVGRAAGAQGAAEVGLRPGSVLLQNVGV
jgi:hypothetical protein